MLESCLMEQSRITGGISCEDCLFYFSSIHSPSPFALSDKLAPFFCSLLSLLLTHSHYLLLNLLKSYLNRLRYVTDALLVFCIHECRVFTVILYLIFPQFYLMCLFVECTWNCQLFAVNWFMSKILRNFKENSWLKIKHFYNQISDF